MLSFEALLHELRDQNLLLALSGGCDSMLLFELLRRAQKNYGYHLETIHLDHRQSDDSWARAYAIQTYVEGQGITCHVAHLPLPQGASETLMRDARYTALRSALKPDAYLVTAHHHDDLDETWWMSLLRGAHTHRLDPIPQKRVFGSGFLIRPLLSWSKEKIRAQHRAWQLPVWEDASNTDEHIERNFIRHQLIPMLRARYPSLETCLEGVHTQHRSHMYWAHQAINDCLNSIAPTMFMPHCALSRYPEWARGDIFYAWALREDWPLEKRFILLLQKMCSLSKGYQKYKHLHIFTYRSTTWVWTDVPDLEGTLEDLWGNFIPPSDEHVALARQHRGNALPRGSGSLRLKKRAQALGVPPWFRHAWPLILDREGRPKDWWTPVSSIMLTQPSSFAQKIIAYYAHMSMHTDA